MRTIYKYTFSVANTFRISMPKGAKVLKVAVQHGTPCMWALVDDEAEKVDKEMGGQLVWHLFGD